MVKITNNIQYEVPYCMLFTNNTVLIEEIQEEAISKLEELLETLKSERLWISKGKAEYIIEYCFGTNKHTKYRERHES